MLITTYNRYQAKQHYDRRINVLPDLEIAQPADTQLRRNREHIKSTPNKLSDDSSGKSSSMIAQDPGTNYTVQ